MQMGWSEKHHKVATGPKTASSGNRMTTSDCLSGV